MGIKNLKDIIKNMPENFCIPEDTNSKFFIEDIQSVVELRKARWLYRVLGEFLNYNISAVSSEHSRKNAYYEEVDYDNIESDKYICKQISEIYAKALNLIGINAVSVVHNQGYDVNHVGTILELFNGMQFYTDLTLDLKNIKTGMKTQKFCKVFPVDWEIQNDFGHNKEKWRIRSIENYEILNDDEISNYIDIPAVGYKQYNLYTDSFLERFSEELKDDEKIKQYITYMKYIPNDSKSKQDSILRYKFEFLIQYLNLENLDYIQGRDFLKEAIKKVFVADDANKFHWFNINKDGENENSKEFATCFILKNNMCNLYYIYQGKQIPVALTGEKFTSKIVRENWKLPEINKMSKDILGREILTFYPEETIK